MSLRFDLSATPPTTAGVTQPIEFTSTDRIYIFNDGIETVSDLGVYISPATVYGDFASQNNNGSISDFYKLIRYGDAVEAGDDTQGGIIIQIQGLSAVRVRTGVGVSLPTKIGSFSIGAGSYKYFDVTFETPTGAPGEVVFYDIQVQ